MWPGQVAGRWQAREDTEPTPTTEQHTFRKMTLDKQARFWYRFPMFYVYELRDSDGRPFYVGKGKGRRMFHHHKNALAGQPYHLHRKIRKLLADGWTYCAVKVFETSDESAALAEEVRLIALYGRANLANMTDGGEGVTGMRHSLETKILLSALNALRPPASEETRRRMSEGNKGKRTGIKASEETREKMRRARLGKSPSQETRDKIAAKARGKKRPWAVTSGANLGSGFKGRKWSPEHREKFLAARVGHEVTQETRDKISKSKKGTIPWNKNKQQKERAQ